MAPFPIPAGAATSVRIIDSTTFLKLPIRPFMSPPMPGFTHIAGPAYCFLIEHSTGRKVLFDLGVRKDWENMAGPVVKMIKAQGWEVKVEKNISEILEEEEGIKGLDVEAIIWRYIHMTVLISDVWDVK
jgi:hypothetical protein